MRTRRSASRVRDPDPGRDGGSAATTGSQLATFLGPGHWLPKGVDASSHYLCPQSRVRPPNVETLPRILQMQWSGQYYLAAASDFPRAEKNKCNCEYCIGVEDNAHKAEL